MTDVALAEWLAAQSQQPLLESEHLLKVFFAEQGAKENLQGTIAAMRDWAEEDAALHAGIARSYLAGTGQFPEAPAVCHSHRPLSRGTGRHDTSLGRLGQRCG